MEERNAWLSLEEKLLKTVMRCCFFLRAAGVVSPYDTLSASPCHPEKQSDEGSRNGQAFRALRFFALPVFRLTKERFFRIIEWSIGTMEGE